MSIQLVTYANQTVTPTNDAIIYEKAIDQNGIFYGCNVTVSSNNVNITGGYGIVCGREFTIQSESIAVTLAPSGTLAGRLYVRLDLADADAPIQLLTATGNTLPALEQDVDVNFTNGAYEMELATFDVGVSSLSGCTTTYETIVGTRKGIEQRTLLWTNPSPNNDFAAQDVTSGLSGAYYKYDFIEIEYLASKSENADYGIMVCERTTCHAGSLASVIVYTTSWFNRHRARWWNDDASGIHFDGAYYNDMVTPSSNGQNDANVIPYRIYGIKIL